MVAKFLDDKEPKIHLKSEFVLFQTSSIAFNFTKFAKCWQSLLGLNPKGLYLIKLRIKKENFVLFSSSGRINLGSFMSKSCNEG